MGPLWRDWALGQCDYPTPLCIYLLRHAREQAKMISLSGILTFIYNSLLVLFISAHLLVGGALTFGAGVYAGIYITQNYDVSRVDEPAKLWEKVKDWAEQNKKKD